MDQCKKLKKLVCRIIIFVSNRKITRYLISDRLFIKAKYFYMMGYKLPLDNPQTFNEKLQWLKLYNRKPIYTTLVDKYEVKKYVQNKIGEEYLIRTLGVWNNADEIEMSMLPEQYVIKCTHDSGSVYICKDKLSFDVLDMRKRIRKSLKVGTFCWGREWVYKNVKPRVIAEEYLSELGKGDVRDYKFFCFDGKVKCFKIDFDRFTDHRANYYDRQCNLLPFGERMCPPNPESVIEMPSNIEEMINIAEKLAENETFVRIDLYNVNGKIYFGEFTFYPASGYGEFTDPLWDKELGNWINLKKSK